MLNTNNNAIRDGSNSSTSSLRQLVPETESFKMWKIDTERYYVELAPERPDSINFWATRSVAVKDDGTRVRENGGGRKGEEFFKYEDSEVSFQFTASRHGRDQKLGDTYKVYLGVHLPAGITADKARTIGRNIRDALLFLPPSPITHAGRPATAVVFDMSYWDKKHPEARVGEVFP